MMMSLFRKDPADEIARRLYGKLVELARRPVFYADIEAPDSVEGRFELLTIHVFLLLRRLKGAGPGADKLAQKIFDAFFQNMDDSLREMGVGDMSIGRKIRAMAESFYGRVGAYEKAMAQSDDSDRPSEPLAHALSRNVFGLENAPGSPRLAAYVISADAALSGQALARIEAGTVDFPPVDAPVDESADAGSAT